MLRFPVSFHLIALCVSCLLIPGTAVGVEGWRVFGALPAISALDVSPDGTRLALLKQQEGETVLAVYDLATRKPLGGLDIRDFKARSISFVSNRHILMRASRAHRLYRSVSKRFENSNAFVFDIETNKVRVLLREDAGIHPVQTGVGKISGVDFAAGRLYMPAFEHSKNPTYNLYTVDIETGTTTFALKGGSTTYDWVVGNGGRVLARIDYHNKKQVHRVFAYESAGKARLIYERKVVRPGFGVIAATPDENFLLIESYSDGKLKHMRLSDGVLIDVAQASDGREIDDVITDENRRLVAIVNSGLRREYEFSDAKLGELFKRIEATFPNAMVDYISATPDKRYIVVKVGGSKMAPAYYLFDSQNIKLGFLGAQYPALGENDVGTVKAFKYAARDGVKIPALLTLPPLMEAEPLPLIVMPHGGPASYDSFGFDWWAQYLANQGYAVFQPNYRGSRGFGGEFYALGLGKWGKEMQDDVTDGVHHLIEQGIADPDRVCIVGASYGGYSALAGGASTPELYRCVISVNGLSDLPLALLAKSRFYGSKHWYIQQWREAVNEEGFDRKSLKKISPVHHADRFQAPVLLIHGNDDAVVPYAHSQRMRNALKRAKKPVTLVKLKGEDHWLSRGETRQQMLKAIDAFVKEHNPPG